MQSRFREIHKSFRPKNQTLNINIVQIFVAAKQKQATVGGLMNETPFYFYDFNFV